VILQGRPATLVVCALAISLAVNFVGAGYLVAGLGHERDPAGHGRALLLAGRSYPAEIRDKLRAALGRDDQSLRGAVRALREARRETFAAMRADPFDPARLGAALAAERAGTARLQEIGHGVLAAVIAEEPAAVRAEIKPMRRGARAERRRARAAERAD
jgi:uncharacterized membrane protein